MSEPPLTRRALLQGLGVGAGLVLSKGLGVGALRPARGGDPSPSETVRTLKASLTPLQRELILFPADHPSRQITNTLAAIERPHLGTLLSPGQLELLQSLRAAMLSRRGRLDFAGTFAVEGRFEGCVLAIYGDPDRGDAQVVLSGGHVMLRGGGQSPGGAPFEGGAAYGHQIGNYRWRVEGNSFAWHGDAANRLYGMLNAEQRARAILPQPPHELVLQVQERGATFPGVALASLSEPAQEAASDLLKAVFALFPEDRRRDARAAIDAHGGIASLHFATYASRGFYEDMVPWSDLDAAERWRRGDPYWQVWRLEGPGTVIHFKGYPHVHAYVNVVREPARANVGETLGRTTRLVEGEYMRTLLEDAMRRATGEALAWHSQEVPGRFCPGVITSGLAYTLDPYGNDVVVASIEPGAMGAPLRDRLVASGLSLDPSRRYRVATADYFARQRDTFGSPEEVEATGTLVRDALVAHLRAGALEAPRGEAT